MAASSGSPNPWPTIGKLIAALVAAGILTAGLLLPYVGGLGLAARHEASKFLDTDCNLQETAPPQKTTLYARDGKTVIATLFSQDRVPVKLSQVPEILRKALIATEDRRFYSHQGVDMRGLIRSAVSTSGGNTQGGSTLTMQYVKQMRYYQAGKDLAKQQAAIDQNLNRKIEDAKCAIFIENDKGESKDTILTNYLNIAFFGENSYGIETAARTYFNKHTSQLTLPESALLVGLLRAPSEYDPFVNPESAKTRRNTVMQNLVDVGDLSQADADKYKAEPIRLATTTPPIVREGCANAVSSIKNVGFFCDYAVHWLETVGGVSDSELKTGGLKIVTTLDAGLQNSIQNNLTRVMPATSPMAAVLPAVDPHTGDVLAMATSKFYGVNKNSRDNRHTEQPVFTSYTAQGASTYKLFPMLTALKTGVPLDWPLATPSSRTGYRPLNCNTDAPATNADSVASYNLNETMATAMAKSSNTYFVGLADQLLNCYLQPIVDVATKLGMKSLAQPSDINHQTIAEAIVGQQRPNQLVLGNIGTSPLEITGAYAAMANDGKYNTPAPILSITDQHGKPMIIKRTPGVQAVAPQVARQAVQALAGDTVAPGTSAVPFTQKWYPKNPSVVAGKTGTSVTADGKKNASLWFVGLTPNLVAASALINFDHPSAPAAGLPGLSDPGTQAYGAYAAGVWADALSPALARVRWSWPSADAVSGVPVPDVIGKPLDEAKKMLAAAGFKMVQLDAEDQLLCPSPRTLGTVAYAGPKIANPGATITVCPSSGIQQTVAAPPKPTRPVTRPGTTSPSRPGSTRPTTGNGRGRGH